MNKKRVFFCCTKDLYTEHSRSISSPPFRKGGMYEVLSETPYAFTLKNEYGEGHALSNGKELGWLQYFIINRRVLIEKAKYQYL